MNGSRNCGLGDCEPVGEVLTVDFWRRVRRVIFRAWFRESFLGFGVWFVPGELVGEGCELLVGERWLCACCARVFSGWFEVICDDLSSIFAFGGAVV